MFSGSVAALLLAAGCTSGYHSLVLTPDDTEGRRLIQAVDSEQAHELLLELLSEAQASSPRSAESLRVVPASLGTSASRVDRTVRPIPTQAELHALGREVSMDFAALTFARALRADDKSRAVREAFDGAIADGPAVSEEVLRRPGTFPHTVLFAPGWAYRSRPEKGADFAQQRRMLDRLGIANRLIPTAESGAVEDNAETIAVAIREGARAGESMILVSASKAGAEVAFALAKLLAPDDAAHVAGWLNANGALSGTPLADKALRPPVSWFVTLKFWMAHWDRAGLIGMRTDSSRTRLEGARIPDSIAVINLIAIPVSGSVRPAMRMGYRITRKQGPSDGLVRIADSVWPSGVNLAALGSDHLLEDFRDDPKGLALLRALACAVNQHRSRGDSLPACTN